MGVKFIFDLDGTLTKQETLPLIAEYFSLENEIKELTEKTVKGEVEFNTSFQFRVNILKKYPIYEIVNLLYHVDIFILLLKFIQENSSSCVIASSNLSCWIEKLVQRYGCKVYASQAIIENNIIVEIKDILQKETIVNNYQKQGDFVIFIGDGNNDVEAMKFADIAIVMGQVNSPSEKLLSVADYVVYTEKELYELLVQLLKKYQ